MRSSHTGTQAPAGGRRGGPRVRATAMGLGLLAAPLFAQTDWPTFGHDLAGSRYSTLKQIDAKNVTKLTRAWTYHMSSTAAAAPAPGSSEAGDAVQGGRGRGGRGGGRGGN